jgi:hypothetical protein
MHTPCRIATTADRCLVDRWLVPDPRLAFRRRSVTPMSRANVWQPAAAPAARTALRTT